MSSSQAGGKDPRGDAGVIWFNICISARTKDNAVQAEGAWTEGMVRAADQEHDLYAVPCSSVHFKYREIEGDLY
jgi:hypothetical protein